MGSSMMKVESWPRETAALDNFELFSYILCMTIDCVMTIVNEFRTK